MREPRGDPGWRAGVNRHLQVGGQLAVFLYRLLVVCNCLLGRLHSLLGLPDPGARHVQLLPQLQFCLTCILLQLVIHLIYCFLGDHEGVGAKEKQGQDSKPGRVHSPHTRSKVRGPVSVPP